MLGLPSVIRPNGGDVCWMLRGTLSGTSYPEHHMEIRISPDQA